MSRGTQLQEMEVGTKQSKTAVNANAKAGEAMPHLSGSTPGQTGGWEDLGGPTPENYKADDDSAKLKTPGATLKQVKDVVNKGAKPAMAATGVKEEEELEDEDLISESELDEDLVEAKEEDEEEEGKKKKSEKEEEEEDEEEEEMEEEYNIEEDVNALIAGEDLSEEFKERAKTIFEAAIHSKVSQIKEELEAQYTAALEEEVSEIKNILSERVDSYLEYVSGEWFEENSLVIEHGLKTEMTESFLSGMKELFEAHYVSIPEDKYDVLESMVEKLDEMETKLNEQIERNISLNKRLAESVADGIFEQISSGLAATQKDKLASLAESVEFESEEQYREKLETLRESYFPSKVVSPKAKTENLSEGVDVAPESYSGNMSAYLRTLSAFSK
jgi:hypothetical protein